MRERDRRYADATYDRHRARDPVLAMAARIRRSTRWRKVRAQVLAKEPTCRLCRLVGLDQAAVEVDHVVGLAERPDLAFTRSNLQPLCVRCHRRKEARMRNGGRVPKAMTPPKPMTGQGQPAPASSTQGHALTALTRELKDGTVTTLQVRPGDVLVVQHPKPLPSSSHERIHQLVAKLFPGHQVLVLDDGASLLVASPEHPPGGPVGAR